MTNTATHEFCDSKGLLNGVSHLKQSTIRIEADKTVYIDPLGINGEPKDADIVFVTHTHSDHFSIPDITKVLKDTGMLVVTADNVKAAAKEGIRNITAVAPSADYTVSGMKIKTVPAYNLNKDFHKKGSNWVGYILDMNNILYYAAGDTDFTPEMKNIKADVVFLPVGGTYTMTAEEAVTAANVIKPSAAVPIHFADIVGTWDDAEYFIANLNKGISGIILKKK